MKKNLFLLLISMGICISCCSQSNTFTLQDSGASTITRWRDTCFALLNLSSSQIPSGILLDYSLNPFNDSNFNSLINPNIDTLADGGTFFSICNILDSSIVNTNGNSIGSSDSLYINAMRYQRNTGVIPLLFLYSQFQKIKSSSLTQNLLSITPDSLRLKDVAGRSSSPYENGAIFSFCPLKTVIAQFNSISFSLPSQFWLMPGISSVQIDFGDGVGFRTLTPNSSVSVYYNTAGNYYLTAKINTTSGLLIAKSSISYSQPSVYIKPDSTWTFSVPPLFTSISNYLNQGNGDFSKSLSGGLIQPASVSSCTDGNVFDQVNCDINPGANVTIVNGCDRVFDKPIIIIQGFDPENVTTYSSLESQFDYPTNVSPGFFTSMRNLGYDFVFVLFTKNNDFIENNAMVLEQVIEKINRVKSGGNKSTIIGYSMGGLIARYALKDMENKSIAHQVQNYFSYDAPQQGANIPVGMQCLFNELFYDAPALKYITKLSNLYGAFRSPAAQEMLATYADFSSGNLSPTMLSPVRAIFAQNMITMGYPQTTKNLALSNGRGNNPTGTKNAGNGVQWNNMIPGSEIFQGGAIFYVDNFSANAYAVNVNTSDYILRYRFSGLKPTRIFGLPISYWAIHAVNIKAYGINPYEDAPGAYENTQSQFVYTLNSKSSVQIVDGFLNTHLSFTFYNSGGANTATNEGHFGHSFVSVASALDLQNQSYGSANNYQSSNMYYNIDANILNPGQVSGNTLNPSSLSPFQAVQTYTSDCSVVNCQSFTSDQTLTVNGYNQFLTEYNNWNLWHEADVSNQSTLFLMRKILNTTTFPACTFGNSLCGGSSSISISGLSAFCSTATYNIASAGGVNGLSIQWSFPNGTTAIVSGQGTPTVNVTKVGDGYETVTLQLTGPCGTATYTYNNGFNNVAVGSPNSLTGTYTLNNNTYPIQSFNSVVVGNIGGNYSWPNVSNISVAHSGSGTWSYGNSNSFGFYLASGQNMNLNFSGTGLCGTVNATRTFQQSGGFAILASPNPATNNINVSIIPVVDTTESNLKSQTISASGGNSNSTTMSLYDINSGVLVKQWIYAEAEKVQYILTTTGVKAGIYVLKVQRNNITESTKIIIQ